MVKKQRATAVAALIGGLAGHALAVTSISDQQMSTWLNNGGLDLANAYAPIYFFGQAMNQPPCIPTWAFGGSPSQPDTFDTAHKTAAKPRCDYPNVGCGCRNPGVAIGNPSPAFPIYYSYQKCNDTDVRVAYNLFYQKDGAIVDGYDTGHDYDWERVIVIHSKTGNGNWQPTRLLDSAHSGYKNYAWGDIQNTLTTDQVNAGNAKDPNGVKNQDHPKVYVAWSKHAMYDDRNTGWNDPISQSTDNAFRSQDWWYYVKPNYYVRSDPSTTAGQALGNADWGSSADSNPIKVHGEMCSAS